MNHKFKRNRKIKFVSVFVYLFLSLQCVLNGQLPVYQIEYQPANPVAGEQVTFTILNNHNCFVETIIPDYANDPGNMLPFTATYTYPDPGTYYVRLDVMIPPVCLVLRDNPSTKRDLSPFFLIRPIGATSFSEAGGAYPLVIGAPAGIPTMSQWAVVILFLLMIIAAKAFQYNRNSRLVQ